MTRAVLCSNWSYRSPTASKAPGPQEVRGPTQHNDAGSRLVSDFSGQGVGWVRRRSRLSPLSSSQPWGTSGTDSRGVCLDTEFPGLPDRKHLCDRHYRYRLKRES